MTTVATPDPWSWVTRHYTDWTRRAMTEREWSRVVIGLAKTLGWMVYRGG